MNQLLHGRSARLADHADIDPGPVLQSERVESVTVEQFPFSSVTCTTE